ALQHVILRMAHDDVVRQAEAKVVHRRGRKYVRSVDHGYVSRARTSAGYDSEVAALKCVQDFPFIMDPPVVDLRLRGKVVIEAKQKFAGIGPADASSDVVAARSVEVRQRKRHEQARAVARESRCGNRTVGKRLVVKRINGSRKC